MKYCPHCKRKVNPKKHWRWLGFIIFNMLYVFYYFMKAPHCPICNAKLGWLKHD